MYMNSIVNNLNIVDFHFASLPAVLANKRRENEMLSL